MGQHAYQRRRRHQVVAREPRAVGDRDAAVSHVPGLQRRAHDVRAFARRRLMSVGHRQLPQQRLRVQVLAHLHQPLADVRQRRGRPGQQHRSVGRKWAWRRRVDIRGWPSHHDPARDQRGTQRRGKVDRRVRNGRLHGDRGAMSRYRAAQQSAWMNPAHARRAIDAGESAGPVPSALSSVRPESRSTSDADAAMPGAAPGTIATLAPFSL